MAATSNESLLLDSVVKGNLLEVDRLIQAVTNLETTNSSGQTPLIIASFLPQRELIIEKLLIGGANPNSRCYSGHSPLFAAASNGSTIAIDLLLIFGGMIDVLDDLGWSPLMVACKNGHISIVLRLLVAGANSRLVNKQSSIALDLTTDPRIRSLLTNPLTEAQQEECCKRWMSLSARLRRKLPPSLSSSILNSIFSRVDLSPSLSRRLLDKETGITIEGISHLARKDLIDAQVPLMKASHLLAELRSVINQPSNLHQSQTPWIIFFDRYRNQIRSIW